MTARLRLVNGDVWTDYSYGNDGTYRRPVVAADGQLRRRAAPRRNSGTGRVCPACGLTRSAAGRCDCNSGDVAAAPTFNVV